MAGELSWDLLSSQFETKRTTGSEARGKFVSGAKVLAAVPSMSQPKDFTRIDLTLADRERVFNKHRNTEIERVFSGMVNRTLSH